MSATELSAKNTDQREARIREATEQGLLVNDAVLLFRKIVDRMPTTTWLLEAKRLVETDPVPEHEAGRKADAKEELDDLHKDLKSLSADWVAGWYARGALYVAKDGAIEDFRRYVETLAPELGALQAGGHGEAAPPETMEKIREAIRPCAHLVVVEMLQSAHLVVSDAMKYALSG
jgi:hypothetical protein